MAKVIPHRETKAERKKERQKIGRLGDQKISPCTRERYHHSLKEVAKYVNLSPQMLLRQDNLDDILSSFVEMLWEDGESRSQGSYAIAAIQHFAPDAKGRLKNAWKLMGLWQKIEQPRRATPLDPSLLLAFVGVFWKWKWEDLACLTVVGFAGLLRTGEMFALRRSDVVLARKANQPSIIFLYDTKTAKRNLLTAEKVLIYERCAKACLQFLCKNKNGTQRLVETAPAKYRAVWKEIVDHLGLNSFHYLPYSLRRGGATSAYKEGMTFEQLLIKGRWQNVSTARLYLDQALQELTQIQLPPTAVARVRAAKLCFKAAGLGRVEGEE